MQSAFVVVLGCWLLHGISGQLSQRLFSEIPDYDHTKYEVDSLDQYDNGVYNDVSSKMKNIRLQRFMNALIMEAGRHVLYPPKDSARFEDQYQRSSAVSRKDRGEPEYMDLVMKREVKTPCPEECPLYQPVCGNDGKVYNSDCHLRKSNCGATNVTATEWELCRGKHFLCPNKCLDINDPVCGQDGRMYHNICVMRKRNCGKFLETRPIKFCYTRETKPMESCPEDCQEIYKPVCGTDGVIYYNECFLKMRTCGSNVEAAGMEACTLPSECPERCIAIYDPVCGSDGKVYTNLCRMLQENCGMDVKRMRWNFCERRKQI